MCRLRFAAALLFPLPLAGQSPAALQARADSLLAEWRTANTLAAAQDSLRHTASIGDRDTFRVGALTILVNRSPLRIAPAAERAWATIDAFFGPAAQALRARPIVITAVDPDTTAPGFEVGEGLHVRWDMPQDELIRLLIVSADLGALDTAVRNWLGGPLAAGLDPERRRGTVYVELVTAPSRAVRRCFEGDTAACRDALSLDGDADMLTRWYGPQERRLLVTESAAMFDRGGRAAGFRACTAGSDSACIDLLSSLPPGALSRPLHYGARLTVLETAVGLGGRGTVQRLLASPAGPMGARLAASAQVPEDSLLARWRHDILTARPPSVSLPAWAMWVALTWAGIFMTCGLGSSRWRVS
jgi:hypothetical protein